ncbi:phosphotransferase [Tessaracoccus sp.]
MTSTVEGLDTALWRLAENARWFAGRSRGGSPARVQLHDWLVHPDSGIGIRSAVLDVDFRGGDSERYHVPLVCRPPAEAVSPELMRVRIDGQDLSIGELCDDPGAAGLLLTFLEDDAPGFERWGEVPVGLLGRRFTGEQSNTSLFFGDQVMCKVFRRLEDGANVDVELHRALAGTGAVAEILGAWRAGDTDLAIFTEALADPQDGFDLAVENARSNGSFAEAAHGLGETLARVHATLAERLPTGSTAGVSLAATFSQRFEAAALEAPEILPYRDAIHRTWDALPTSLTTQRIHGDCHLGQVLLSRNEWRYVDFEGEPLKTLAERREPDSRLRDVAGMLRSFDYAAATGGGDASWLVACRAAFMQGYGLPGADEKGLLAAFEADKAIYEVIYERRNRPHLIHVPIDSLNRLAGETR